jgi:flagellar biosynthetic protein FliR
MRWLSAGILDAAGGLWLAGLQIAGPVLAVTVVADVTLGFVGKVAPQLPATLAGIPVKNVLGLSVMGIGARAWPRFFEREFVSAIAQAEKVLHLAR